MSNVETYLSYLTGNYEGELPLPRPIRHEIYLATLCGIDHGQELPEPVTKADAYLRFLAENGTGEKFYITDTSYLFCENLRLEEMDEYRKIIKDCDRADSMFLNSTNLPNHLDLSWFDTSKIGLMSDMFRGCYNLRSINFTGWDTSNCHYMDYMFEGCSKLTTIDLPKLNTQNVWYMNEMFKNCRALTSLDLSNFKTSANSGWRSLFQNCEKLTSLDFSVCNTGKITVMQNMFSGCSSLESITGFSATNKAGIDIGFPYGTLATPTSLKRLVFRTDLADGTYAIRSAIRIQWNAFRRQEMVELFNSLPDVSGLGLTTAQSTITITGNPCVMDEINIPAGTAYNSYGSYEVLCAEAKRRYRGYDYQNAPLQYYPYGSSSTKAITGVFSDIIEDEIPNNGLYVHFLADTLTIPDEDKLSESDKQIALDKGWTLTI